MNMVQLTELKSKLQKSYFWEKKKIYNLFSKASEEELEYLLNDDKIIKIIRNIKDYEFLFMIFRIVPASIQEKIWENNKQQKILFAINNKFDDLISDSFKESDEESENYISEEKVRKIQLLLRSIKSQKILDSLVDNIYFQAIILYMKKIPDELLKYIDIKKIYVNIINNFYSKLNVKIKRRWIFNMNTISDELLFPDDVRNVLPEQDKIQLYSSARVSLSLSGMLKNKLSNLRKNEKTLKLDSEQLKKLTVLEMTELLDNSCQSVVSTEELFRIIDQIIDEAIVNDTILNESYFSLSNISTGLGYYIFNKVCNKSFKSPSKSQKLLDLIFNYLFKNDYSEEEKKQLYLSLENALLNANKNDVINLFFSPTDIKSLFFLRFNLCGMFMDYLNGIDEKQIMKINVRHIGRLASYLQDSSQDEISDIYGKAIKLYLVFGLEKACDILNGKYGKTSKLFFDNVSKLDVCDVPLINEGKNYVPSVNKDFINFLFSNNKAIFELFQNDNILASGWYYLYNNFAEIKEICKGHVTVSQAKIILKEQVNNVKYDLDPDCYDLCNILYEVGLGNRSKHSNEEVYQELVRVYREQRKRIYSSIPYVKGVSNNGYGYEVMRMDDLVAYNLGYKANCCIRILDIAHNHLLHALLCENVRILITYKPDGTIASFSPLKRNGELLIVNSIEMVSKGDEELLMVFNDGIQAIKDKTMESDEKIRVVCIGEKSSLKPEGELWPKDIKTPTILEKDDEVYKDTDIYHDILRIINKDEDVDLEKLKYGKLDHMYMDERKPIKVCTFSKDNCAEQYFVLKKVDAVRYVNFVGSNEKNFRKSNSYGINYVFYSDDWYVLIDYSGKMYYECLENDSRSKKEMEATIAVINEYTNKKKDIKKLVLMFNDKKVQG